MRTRKKFVCLKIIVLLDLSLICGKKDDFSGSGCKAIKFPSHMIIPPQNIIEFGKIFHPTKLFHPVQLLNLEKFAILQNYFILLNYSIDQSTYYLDYGNMSCHVLKGGTHNQLDFGPKMPRCQKVPKYDIQSQFS